MLCIPKVQTWTIVLAGVAEGLQAAQLAEDDVGHPSAYSAAHAEEAAQDAHTSVAGLASVDSSLAAAALSGLPPSPWPGAGPARTAAITHAAAPPVTAPSREPLSRAAAAGDTLLTSRDASRPSSPVGSLAACSPLAQGTPAAGHSSSNIGALSASGESTIGRGDVTAEAGVQQEQPEVSQGSPPELQHGRVAAWQPAQTGAPAASSSGGSGLAQTSPDASQAHASRHPLLDASSPPLAQVCAGHQESLQPCSTDQDVAISNVKGNSNACMTQADQAIVDLFTAQEDTAARAAAPVAVQAPDSLLPKQLPASSGASTGVTGGLAAGHMAAGSGSASAGLAAAPGARQAASPVAGPSGPEVSLHDTAATPASCKAAATGAMQPDANRAADAGRSAVNSGQDSGSQGAQLLHSQAAPQAVSRSHGLYSGALAEQ